MIYEPLTEIGLNVVYPTFDVLVDIQHYLLCQTVNIAYQIEIENIIDAACINAFGHRWLMREPISL